MIAAIWVLWECSADVRLDILLVIPLVLTVRSFSFFSVSALLVLLPLLVVRLLGFWLVHCSSQKVTVLHGWVLPSLRFSIPLAGLLRFVWFLWLGVLVHLGLVGVLLLHSVFLLMVLLRLLVVKLRLVLRLLLSWGVHHHFRPPFRKSENVSMMDLWDWSGVCLLLLWWSLLGAGDGLRSLRFWCLLGGDCSLLRFFNRLGGWWVVGLGWFLVRYESLLSGLLGDSWRDLGLVVGLLSLVASWRDLDLVGGLLSLVVLRSLGLVCRSEFC